MDVRHFYRQLFAPLITSLGPLDEDSMASVVGFDAGGSLTFCTIRPAYGQPFTTYISCELAVRPEQKPGICGRYELLISCDDGDWAMSRLTQVGRMTLDIVFGDGDSLDIGPWVQPDDFIQGLVFEQACAVMVEGTSYGVLRCIGVTRMEMEYSLANGVRELLAKLKEAGVYPNTTLHRRSVV